MHAVNPRCACARSCVSLVPHSVDLRRAWQRLFEQVQSHGARCWRLLAVIPACSHEDSLAMLVVTANAPSIESVDKEGSEGGTPGIAATPAVQSYWDKLDGDLVVCILQLAGIAATGAASAASRALRASVLQEELWKTHVLNRFPASEMHAAGLPGIVAGQLLSAGCSWQGMCRDLCAIRQVEAWREQVLCIRDQTRASVAAEADTDAWCGLTQKRLEDAQRRLSGLQLNDFREAQRISPPPAELVTAAALLRLLLEGAETSHDEASMQWFREILPCLGAKFGEQAQEHVGVLLKRMLAFDASETPSTRFDAVELALETCHTICMKKLDERLRVSMQARGGMSDEARALRVASAVTRWVIALVQNVAVTRRLRDCAMVLSELRESFQDLRCAVLDALGDGGQEEVLCGELSMHAHVSPVR